jgi:hypothetical protein
MSYDRVIPRDLFNEAGLLKCYGQIYLELEKLNNADVTLVEGDIGDGFRIEQDASDGSISLANVHLLVRGEFCTLSRPLNARSPYPLYLTTVEDDVLTVFTDDGRFTDEMKAFLA